MISSFLISCKVLVDVMTGNGMSLVNTAVTDLIWAPLDYAASGEADVCINLDRHSLLDHTLI